MSTHTPGPWLVCDGPSGYQHRIFNANTGGDTVCDVVGSHDASLIAAAPELLESAIAFCEMMPGLSGGVEFDAMRSAIAKATGELP